MKYCDIKDKPLDELYESLNQLKKEQMMMRFQLKTGAISDVSSVKKCRRNIAKVLTALCAARNLATGTGKGMEKKVDKGV